MGDSPRTNNEIGRSKLQYSTEDAGSEGSGGEPSQSSYHPLEPSFYSRPPSQPGSAQYEQQHQYDTNYGLYPLNQGTSASGGTYPEQQRNYSPSYTQQQSPHYAPLSPSGYPYTSQHTASQPLSQQTHHGMSYNNPQQSIYSSALSPGHYGSPNHGQHSSYSPSSSQQWPPQQASPADYTHHSSPSPQRSVLAGSTGSPSATPSPAHTPTSPPPPPSAAASAMSGQFPSHHHGRHPPMGSPQPVQGHGLPTWGHPGVGQAQGMGMHPGSSMVGPPPQAPGYYPAPHPSMVGPGRGIQGPPQHAHMSSAPGADRHSPHHPVVPGAWNNLGMPVTKAPGSHEGGRGPPATSHPQNSSASNSGGPGNPLFSLQMLVNQDMNRNAAAAAAAQAGTYRGQTPAAAHQQESVDLSPASGEAYPRMPQQSVPIPLTRMDKQSEHSSLRNGSIIASSTAVSSTNVTSPPTPLNGEVSSDSGIGSSSAAPTPSSLPDNSTSTVLSRDGNKLKSVVESKSPVPKETVSVIAQTPPREKPKISSQVIAAVASSSSSPSLQSSEAKLERKIDSVLSGFSENRMESSRPSSASDRDMPAQSIRPLSADSLERSNIVMRTNAAETSSTSVESTTNISVTATNNNAASVKQAEDSLSIPSPTQSTTKDSTSPVRSPKSGSLKRAKKVDSILENLVESGSKKFGGSIAGTEQPPQIPVSTVVVAPASVIISPAITNEDSSSREVRTPSPGVSQQKPGAVSRRKSPITVREDDVVSPTFNSYDDVENGKPRRKRKLDKPIRVSKSSSDTEGTKSNSVEDITIIEEIQRPEESGIPIENKDSLAVSPSESVVEQASEKSVEGLTKVLDCNALEKVETTRRRRSSEGSSTSQSPKPANQRTRRKSESDQQDDTEALLSVLVSDQQEKSQEPKPEVKNAFIEVETELEKMFAGIVETDEAIDPLKLDDTSSPVSMEVSPTTKALESLTNLTSADAKPSLNMKRGRPKGSRNGARSSESIFGTSSTESTPKKKKKQQKRPSEDFPTSSQSKKMKRSKLFQGENNSLSRDSPIPKRKGSSGLIKSEPVLGGTRDSIQVTASYDSGSNTSSSRSRGPVIHVEGPRDSPYYVSIINAPSRGGEDEEGGEKGSSKKQAAGGTRRKNPGYHNDLEYRGKVSRAAGSGLGLFSSTLSARYDAHTTDPSWICVFCKRGPHSAMGQSAMGNGDLFGPYVVGKEKAEDGGLNSPFVGCEPSADERDITEEQKRGGKNKRSLRGAEMVEQFCQKMSKKVKRSQSIDNSPVLGMVPIAPSSVSGKDEACFEVWVHEECAVWAAGVHLVGSRIVGLQEAVWGAVHTLCSKCGEGGANVGCVRRACEWRLHYGCALDQGWDLNEEAYIARCSQHKGGVYAGESILPT